MDEYCAFVSCETALPQTITKLTGITDDMLRQAGVAEESAVRDLMAFIGDDAVISHNTRFDYGFIREACKRHGLPVLSNACIDTAALAKRTVSDVDNYQLATLAEFYSIAYPTKHRSLADCMVTKQLYDKLIEKRKRTE